MWRSLKNCSDGLTEKRWNDVGDKAVSKEEEEKEKSKQRFDVPGYSCKYFSIPSIYDSTHLNHHVSLY